MRLNRRNRAPFSNRDQNDLDSRCSTISTCSTSCDIIACPRRGQVAWSIRHNGTGRIRYRVVANKFPVYGPKKGTGAVNVTVEVAMVGIGPGATY